MTDGGSARPETDELAAALWEARRVARPVPGELPWDTLSEETAAGIGQALYRRVSDDPPRAWKMGAFDAETRGRLGLREPLLAAVLPDRLHTGADRVELRLADFVAAKLEPEIGIRSGPSGTWFVPCVEVADCRFAGWQPPPLAATADFGLQGAMVFGLPVPAPDSVHVHVRRDGEDVGSASASWDEALGRLGCAPVPRGVDVHFATGGMTPLFPAVAGLWEFEFAGLGTLSLALY